MSDYTLAVIILALMICVFSVIIARVYIIEKKIRTLIEAHNALATDFSTSMHVIKKFNEAVDAEMND